VIRLFMIVAVVALCACPDNPAFRPDPEAAVGETIIRPDPEDASTGVDIVIVMPEAAVQAAIPPLAP